MCIDNDKECPINMIIMKNSSEPPTEYNYTFKSIMLMMVLILFYTNEAIEHHIVGEIKISDDTPCWDPYDNNMGYNYVLYHGYNYCDYYDENYTLIDMQNVSLLYDLYNITKIIKELQKFSIETLNDVTTHLYYRTFVGYNKECMKDKNPYFLYFN